MHSTGTIFLDRKWLATNMEKFAKDYDALAKKPEDKGTHIMIKVDLQDTTQFVITNETLNLSMAAIDEKDPKKTFAYLTINHDMEDPSIQERVAQWLIGRLAKLQAAANILLRTDSTES